MSDRRWRGTVIYAGTLAAMGVVGVARFVVLAPLPAVSAASTDGVGGSTIDRPGGPSSGSSSGVGARGPDLSATSTDAGGSSATQGTSDPVTIVGSSVQTRYGPVQVSVTFAAGQITGVEAVTVPDAHRESVQINTRAAPILAQEVLSAQSSQIDTVSGATYTSEAYAQSVQFAIDQQG